MSKAAERSSRYTTADDRYRQMAIKDVAAGKHLRMRMTRDDYIAWRIRNARGNRNRGRKADLQ